MPRMLVVVAHPDDETFGTGSTIAKAASDGVEVTVVCATRGEAGEDTSGTTSSPEELAAVREGELRAAAKVLGAHDVIVLGFGDSDMDGDPPPGSLMAAPIDSVIEPIATIVEQLQPDVVITLDPDSVRDHRDHMRIGEATTRAFAQTAKSGARLYHWTLMQSAMKDWIRAMHAQGLLEAYDEDMVLGRPDEEVTTIVDVGSVIDTRRAAIAEHKTQVSPFHGLDGAMLDSLLCRDHFVRAVPPWTGGPIETSLWG